jgi:hypothetical protein
MPTGPFTSFDPVGFAIFAIAVRDERQQPFLVSERPDLPPGSHLRPRIALITPISLAAPLWSEA